MNDMSTRSTAASARSSARRPRPLNSGRRRYLTGRVPGRRPTNSPPVSVGSLFIAVLVTRARPLRLVQRVEQVGVLLVHDVALDLQRRRQLSRLLREVVVEDDELLHAL